VRVDVPTTLPGLDILEVLTIRNWDIGVYVGNRMRMWIETVWMVAHGVMGVLIDFWPQYSPGDREVIAACKQTKWDPPPTESKSSTIGCTSTTRN